MRDRIITIVAVLAFVLTIIFMINGMKIGNMQISSIKQIIQKNEETNQKIEEVAKITNIDYESATQNIEKVSEELKNSEEKYYDLLENSSDGEDKVYETEEYDIAYLWTIIGRYATQLDINLGMNVVKSASLYNLEFTLKGTYNDISKFITKIENDSELHFRIYDFKLLPGVKLSGGAEKEDTKRLQATFSVKDINLNKESLTTTTSDTNNLNSTKQNNNNTNTQNASNEITDNTVTTTTNTVQ